MQDTRKIPRMISIGTANPPWRFTQEEANRLAVRISRSLVIVLVIAALTARPSRGQAPGVYHIDGQASRIEIHVFRGGFLGKLGDNHQIVASPFSGSAERSGRSAWRVHVMAESGSLQVMDPGVSASTREEIRRTMLGPTQLDTQRFPAIELQSRSLLPGEPDKSWRLLVDLTLHGVTGQVEFPLAWIQDKDRLGVQGRKVLLLRDFGIQPIRKGLGAIQVRNDFELTYDITLHLLYMRPVGARLPFWTPHDWMKAAGA